MWRKLIARYLLLARAILPLLRHTRGAARGRRKSPRRLLGLGSAAFSPFYCDKNPDGERPAFWKTGLYLLVEQPLSYMGYGYRSAICWALWGL